MAIGHGSIMVKGHSEVNLKMDMIIICEMHKDEDADITQLRTVLWCGRE